MEGRMDQRRPWFGFVTRACRAAHVSLDSIHVSLDSMGSTVLITFTSTF